MLYTSLWFEINATDAYIKLCNDTVADTTKDNKMTESYSTREHKDTCISQFGYLLNNNLLLSILWKMYKETTNKNKNTQT